MMDDLISRQAAIDAVDRAATKEAARWSLQELPSAQPKLIKAKIGHEPTVDETENLKKVLSGEPIVLLPSVQPEIIPLPSETPCDVCRYNPPSSMDGKPCCICPAEGREG